VKFTDAIQEFILYKQSLGMSYKSRALKLNAFARFAGPVEIDSISPETVRRFLDGDRPVTTEWFNKFSALKMFYRFALSRGYVTHNPLPISQPKSPRQFRPYIYSMEEVQKMIRVVDNRHRGNWHLEPYTVRTLILLLYGTGLRIGEAIRLQHRDVDLNEAILTVRETKFYKTRLVPVSSDLTGVLRSYFERKWKGSGASTTTPFLATYDGRPVTHLTAELAFKRTRYEAGVKRTDGFYFQPRLHDFRHYAESRTMPNALTIGADWACPHIRDSA
jgi:integrase/recombinase XerD